MRHIASHAIKKEKNEKEKKILEKEREKGDKGGDESPENKNNDKRKIIEVPKNSNPKTNKSKIEYNVKYVGETARSSYERSCEHVRDLKGLEDKSHLLKH